MSLPIIGITMGDPAGIGPEIIVKSLMKNRNFKDYSIIVIGDSNCLRNEAKKNKIATIGFLGNNGGKLKKLCSHKVIVESKNTARIQEAHIFLGHFIFTKVEDLIRKKN